MIIKKPKIMLSLGGVFLLGLLLAVPLRPAQAQVCAGWGQPCAFPGISKILDVVIEKLTEQVINLTMEQINNGINQAVNAMVGDIMVEENEMEDQMRIEWESLWEEEQKVYMQDFTRQETAMNVREPMQRGMFMDANATQEALVKQNELIKDSHQEHRPSGDSCVVGSAGGSLMHTWQLSRAYNNAADRQFLDRAYNSAAPFSTPWGNDVWAGGSAAEIPYRWDDYQRIFCDPTQSQANAPCIGYTPGNDFENLDVNPARLFFNNGTIEIQDERHEKARYAAVQNLIQPFIEDPVAPADLNSPDTIKAWMQKRSRIARQMAAFTVVNDLAARRIPSEDVNQSLQEIRANELGMPGFKFSDYPSYNEVMKALTKERFWAEEYYIRMGEEPENVARQKANLSALYLMQLRDYYEVLERATMLLAIQVAVALDKQQVNTVTREPRITP